MSDGPNRRFLPAIRAAIRVGQRPTAAIFRDHFALNYNAFTDEVDEVVWTAWDFALLDVCQMIEDYANPNTGEFPWVEEDDNLEWKTSIKHSRKQAAIDSVQNARGKNDALNRDGEMVTAEIDWEASPHQYKKKPSEWFAEQAKRWEKNQPRPDATLD